MRQACRFVVTLAALCFAHIIWGSSQPALAEDVGSARTQSRNDGGQSSKSVRQSRGLLCDSVDAEFCFLALARSIAKEPAQTLPAAK
jgi:hypothetical protein